MPAGYAVPDADRAAVVVCLVIISFGVFASAAKAADGGAVGSGAALDSLLAHVPSGHRETCRADMGDEDVDAVMSVRCELASGITVRYSQLVSAEAADARYLDRVVAESLEPDTGDCSVAPLAEQSYSVGGEPAGRLLCYESFGYESFEWTHDASDIYATAIKKEDLAGLWEWWATESGPLSSPDEASLTGAGAALDTLLSRAPESFRSTCRAFDGGDPEDGVVVSIKCEVADDLTVYDHQLDSAEALEQQYQGALDQAGIGDDVGDCSESSPGEQPYTIGGEPAGRLVCSDFLGSTWFTWSHLPTLIVATASVERSLADTWTWWFNESGPVS